MRMRTIVGQSSGNLTSFSAYALVEWYLPNSKIKFRVSSAYSIGINGDESLNSVETDIPLDPKVDMLNYTEQLIIKLSKTQIP